MLAWQALDGLDAYQVTEIPRRASRPPGDAGRIQRIAALAAAYHAEEPLVIGWVRHRPGDPVRVIVAGPGLVGGEASQEVLLTLPAGARARPLPSGTLARLMSQLPHWRALGLLAGGERRSGEGIPPSLEECLLAVWPGSFGWLLTAEPLASTGLWRVRLLAGGGDTAAAARVAGLACASADLTGLRYALAPAGGAPRPLRDLLEDPGLPFEASTELVAAVCRPPEREVPGVRLALRPDFDVTQEPPAGREAITVGEILDASRWPAGPLALSLDSLNRHVFVSGATGSGKSQTVRALLDAAAEAGIPWLVMEPTKAEYRLMAAPPSGPDKAGPVVIRPGESDAIAAGLNPLVPAPGFPLQTHADLVKALFLASFGAEEPVTQLLGAALAKAYADAGWDMALGETLTEDATPRYPDLADLQRAAEEIARGVGYRDVPRLSSLRLGTAGRFLQGSHQLDFGRLLRANAVLELGDVGDDGDKAFVMGITLIRLAEHLRMAARAKPADAAAPVRPTGLRHLTVIEEARRLFGPGAPAHVFAGLLAELRAYGEGLILVEQIPAHLAADVIKNTAVKITHRLPATGRPSAPRRT